MTKKRLRYMRAFLIDSSEFVIDDNVTHEKLKKYGILDRLNEQHETITRLEKENEKLKQELQDIYKLIDKKIEEADKEFLDYHSERENDIILARWRALQDLKEELER